MISLSAILRSSGNISTTSGLALIKSIYTSAVGRTTGRVDEYHIKAHALARPYINQCAAIAVYNLYILVFGCIVAQVIGHGFIALYGHHMAAVPHFTRQSHGVDSQTGSEVDHTRLPSPTSVAW